MAVVVKLLAEDKIERGLEAFDAEVINPLRAVVAEEVDEHHAENGITAVLVEGSDSTGR